MPRLILFSFRAENELESHALDYERKRLGLGMRFEAAVRRLTQTISNQPYLYGKYRRNIRVTKVHRFPFNLFYIVRRRVIEIAVIVPSLSNPITWPMNP